MASRRFARAGAIAVLVGVLTGSAGAAPADAAPEAPQPDVVAELIADYRAEIPELMAREDIPGLALVVVDGDTVVWQEGFGTTRAGGSQPVTVDTMFSVQSMSKVFTATAVLQAVQAGRLDLDVPITTYLPDFTVHSAFESHPERTITLRMLLGHTAGFTHEAPLGNNYESDAPSFDAHVESISDTWLRFPVGTGYAYSNLGIDLAAAILQKVSGVPFPLAMRDSLLAPLGMSHSTFDRAEVRASTDRAVGHSGNLVRPGPDIPMVGAGGLWASAADLGQFLRLQLGDGVVDGRTVLDPDLMAEMREIPAPHAGDVAGYALGVARTRWPVLQNLDLFSHGGGGYGFLSDLWWVPQLDLGIALLTNSATHDLQGALALRILGDLVNTPGSEYFERMRALPSQTGVADPDGHFVPPPDLGAQIAALALPASTEQSRRWAEYGGSYRTGRLGTMNPGAPASRFYVDAGVPYFDACEDGTAVRHRLTEVRPGTFLAENGETLDLSGASPSWRGMALHPVSDGPLRWQWALLAGVAVTAAGWLLTAAVRALRRRRSPAIGGVPRGRAGRVATAVTAGVGALAALVVVGAIGAMPSLVEVGFLGWMAMPVPVQLAFHLPLAVAALAATLTALQVAGAARHWWTPRLRAGYAILAVALGGLTALLAAWHMIG